MKNGLFFNDIKVLSNFGALWHMSGYHFWNITKSKFLAVTFVASIITLAFESSSMQYLLS